jgi:parallel beta-helix repeat protein
MSIGEHKHSRRWRRAAIALVTLVALAATGSVVIWQLVVDDPESTPARAPEPTAAPQPGEVPITPSDDPQAIVDEHPSGTTYVIRAGVHRRYSVRPKTGDTFVAEPGAVLDGEGEAPYAFYAFRDPRDDGAHEVTIRGASKGDKLVIKDYATLNQQQVGAIHPQVDTRPFLGRGDRWSVQWVEVLGSYSTGIITGSQMTIRESYIHHNGQLGIGGTGSGSVVDGNEIAYNNTGGFDVTHEAGGAKWALLEDLTVTRNNVHHNEGPGLWTDIDVRDVTIAGNRIAYNQNEGILHEISHDAIIRDNTIIENGRGQTRDWLWGGGIVISTSDHVEVRNNVITGNGNGITAVQQERGRNADGRVYLLDDISVFDNTVTENGITGVAQDTSNPAVFRRQLRFDRNTYRGGAFACDDNDVEWRGWQACGHDPSGTWSPS